MVEFQPFRLLATAPGVSARMAFDNAEFVRIGIRAPIPAALSYSRRWKSEHHDAGLDVVMDREVVTSV